MCTTLLISCLCPCSPIIFTVLLVPYKHWVVIFLTRNAGKGSRWSRGLSHGIAGSSPAKGMDVCLLRVHACVCVCVCVLSGRGLCIGLITPPNQYYRLWFVWVWFCGLVVRVSGYRYRGPGFDLRRYQIFRVVVGLEQGPLSLVRSNWVATWIKKKVGAPGSENRD